VLHRDDYYLGHTAEWFHARLVIVPRILREALANRQFLPPGRDIPKVCPFEQQDCIDFINSFFDYLTYWTSSFTDYVEITEFDDFRNSLKNKVLYYLEIEIQLINETLTTHYF